MVPPVLKSNFNTLNCVLFCSLALKCTSTFITVLVKTTNNYICYLELRYKYNCYNYSHPGGVNTFLSCKSCELVPIFYYRDKTRVYMFHFLNYRVDLYYTWPVCKFTNNTCPVRDLKLADICKYFVDHIHIYIMKNKLQHRTSLKVQLLGYACN